MGVYIGEAKNTNAVRSALMIHGAVLDVIQPAIDQQYPKEQYPNLNYKIKHVVGVDTSKLFVCRIGVRNDNDLVWVGRAANYAAKLSALPDDHAIYITDSVHDVLSANVASTCSICHFRWRDTFVICNASGDAPESERQSAGRPKTALFRITDRRASPSGIRSTVHLPATARQ